MFRLAPLVLLAAFTPSYAADPPKEKDEEKPPAVAGDYTCAGTDGTGKKYEGTVTITKNGDSFTVEWELSDGTKYAGVGVLTGRVLSVGWSEGRSLGTMAYTVAKDGSMAGKWAVLGDPKGRVLTESLKKKKST